jgi:Xaa-Pro dipeptidase
MTSIFQKRRDNLLDHLAACDLSAAMLSDPISIAFFTGVKIKPYERFLGLVMDGRNRCASLVLPSLERSAIADPGVVKVFCGDHENPMACLADLLNGIDRLGVEKNSLALGLADTMAHHLNVQLLDIGEFVVGQRLLKDSSEVDIIRKAAGYSDAVYEHIAPMIKPGVSEKSIMFAILDNLSRQPDVLLDDFVIQVLSGVNSANPHGSSGDRVFEKGDAVTIDFVVNYRHYWSDCTRTFFAGRPPEAMVEIYNTVLSAQQKALSIAGPGVPLMDIDLAARGVIEKAGYGDCFIHRTGHGIGMEMHEAPSIHCNNKMLAEPGMVFTVEPGIYVPDLGGVRIEDDLFVSGSGTEIITGYPKDFAFMVIE